jgi:site-specific DNA recombinase
MKPIRCAIYTRKSSDEGLEQGFNSLDAQREACAAYILSQASEGWVALPDLYDDGGISGGTLERPALQRLLADVAAGQVDVIVVYKVDRLSRSLFDFAKLVEAFEKAGTSFVSITQSFNTTSSMGRLTLNMLLSFAQFEREVTAERIRDKIAASKAKGMWMGGIPPLGYAADGRSLRIVDDHAALVRAIFERYLNCGTVRTLAMTLDREGLHAPIRETTTGKRIGGRPFSRGQLYLMLKCRTYLGEVQHHQEIHPGLHPAIVDRSLWEAVQARLADHVQGQRGPRGPSVSLLAGKLVDQHNNRLIASHACKAGLNGEGRVRYRYYISDPANDAGTAVRIPAREIEGVVIERLASSFDDGLALATATLLIVAPHDIAALDQRCSALAAAIRGRNRELVASILSRIEIGDHGIVVHCDTAAIAEALRLTATDDAPSSLSLEVRVRLTRSGRAMRLVQGDGALAISRSADPALVRLILQARGWWREVRQGGIDITTLAARESCTPSYMTRVIRLAFLAPSVVDAILAGRQRQGVTANMLTLQHRLSERWGEQEQALLPDRATK